MTLASAVAPLGTILSLWAHPDDESYLCAGIMAAAADNGQRVVCVSASAGERGTPDAGRWPPERLGRMRRWEAAAAMAVLGVADHRFLDLPDGGMAGLDPAPEIARIGALLDEVRPDTILTFGPDGGTFHPDHQALSAWTTAAWHDAGRPGRLLQAAQAQDHLDAWLPMFDELGVFMTDERPTGHPSDRLALDLHLAGDLLDRKMAALCAMFTQIGPLVAAVGEEAFWAANAREMFVDADLHR
ncbi:MAG TPA: PIG-L family deacetylase [Acidimicrobiales bacterium]|nr:PIG-L family deacetylase [Acidimicrobiales bacterium]